MTDIYAFAFNRTRETIVPRHQRHILIESSTGVPDLVGLLGRTEHRLSYGALRAPNPPAAERERVTS